MALRRKQRPKTAPASSAVALSNAGVNGVPGNVQNAQDEGADTSAEALADQLIRQFSTALSDDSDVDRDTAEFLTAQLTDALHKTAQAPDQMVEIDKSEWFATVRALQESGAMQEDEGNALIRQIDKALEPLDRRESKLAFEFSRRLREQGQEAALAWFRTESAKLQEEDKAEAPPHGFGTPEASLDSETIQSRSRRLRGPPRLR